MLARFDIVLVVVPFTDGPNAKPRPVMVIGLSERHQDVLFAFVNAKVAGTVSGDERDRPAEHPRFGPGGLKSSSRSGLSRSTTLALLTRDQPLLRNVRKMPQAAGLAMAIEQPLLC